MVEHRRGCICVFCAALAKRVMPVARWDLKHRDHGPKTEAPFDHPSGRWFWRCCPCGAKQLRIRDEVAP